MLELSHLWGLQCQFENDRFIYPWSRACLALLPSRDRYWAEYSQIPIVSHGDSASGSIFVSYAELLKSTTLKHRLTASSDRIGGFYLSRSILPSTKAVQTTESIACRRTLEVGSYWLKLPDIRFRMLTTRLAMGRRQLPMVESACPGLLARIWIAHHRLPDHTILEQEKVSVQKPCCYRQ